MEQFSLEKWLQDKSRKVVTRDGRSVNIIYDHMKGLAPIIALIQWNENDEHCFMYNSKGRCVSNEATLDLFFADEEEEPASEDLEEEVHKHLLNIGATIEMYSGNVMGLDLCEDDYVDFARHFAEWQKNQMKEVLQTEYEKGRFDMREEMMKNAVDATIFSELKGSNGSLFQAKSDRFRMNGVKISDRIKVIPIKTEQ